MGQAKNEGLERANEGMLQMALRWNRKLRGPGPLDDDPLPKAETRELLPPRPLQQLK